MCPGVVAAVGQVKEGGRKNVARGADGTHTASSASVANSSPLSLSAADVALLSGIVRQCEAIPGAGAGCEAVDGSTVDSSAVDL